MWLSVAGESPWRREVLWTPTAAWAQNDTNPGEWHPRKNRKPFYQPMESHSVSASHRNTRKGVSEHLVGRDNSILTIGPVKGTFELKNSVCIEE